MVPPPPSWRVSREARCQTDPPCHFLDEYCGNAPLKKRPLLWQKDKADKHEDEGLRGWLYDGN